MRLFAKLAKLAKRAKRANAVLNSVPEPQLVFIPATKWEKLSTSLDECVKKLKLVDDKVSLADAVGMHSGLVRNLSDVDDRLGSSLLKYVISSGSACHALERIWLKMNNECHDKNLYGCVLRLVYSDGYVGWAD
ncbi:hypothetical protein ACJBU6_07390 [Exserohilum turcicum]